MWSAFCVNCSGGWRAHTPHNTFLCVWKFLSLTCEPLFSWRIKISQHCLVIFWIQTQLVMLNIQWATEMLSVYYMGLYSRLPLFWDNVKAKGTVTTLYIRLKMVVFCIYCIYVLSFKLLNVSPTCLNLIGPHAPPQPPQCGWAIYPSHNSQTKLKADL